MTVVNPNPRAAAPYLRRVADRVHAYVQPDGGWCLNNAGIIGHEHRAAEVLAQGGEEAPPI